MKYRMSLIAVSCLILSGCAYTQDGMSQKLTIETPGAENAKCHVTIDKLKYVFYPPEEQTVVKSGKPMEVACMAPGNRNKTVMVEAKTEGSTYNNLFGPGIFGLGWDRASNAIFTYPSIVRVDFTDVPATTMPMPQHNNPDIMQPEEHRLEEFLATNPKMNRDKNRSDQTLLRKGEYDFEGSSVDVNPALGKGDLQPVAGQ